jgi:mannose-6-phosphate isomerase-like protein (cupin superfamily)
MYARAVDKINLADKLASFDELWVPKVVGELNGQYVKVVKFEGEYVWHHHENEDEMFYVLRGSVAIHLRDRIVELGPGEMFVVERGVEHKPVSDGISDVLLFEPATTRNTGDVDHDYTIEAGDLEQI